MSVALHVVKPGELAFAEEEDEPVPDGRFRARTLYSGLSAGTELTYLKGTNPYLTSTWDPALGLFHPDRAGISYPVRKLGYMEVGRVAESRTAAFPDGQLVAMAFGHRTGYLADPTADHIVPLPADLDPVLGVYAAHMGPICANGLLHAAADLYGGNVHSLADGVAGRLVAVTGAGVVGLLTALFARWHGAAGVVVVDRTPDRLAAARCLDLDALDERDNDPGLVLKRRWRHGAGDHGADVVFQCRGQPASLATALRLLRPAGTVIDLAFYQSGADSVRLGEEFHHNGLGIRCAQVGRVPRGLGHVWDRARLSAETVAMLRSCGAGVRSHLITDLVPFEAAPALMYEVAERRRHVIQAVFAMPEAGRHE